MTLETLPGLPAAPSPLRAMLSRCWPRLAPPTRRTRGPLKVGFIITSMPVGGAETLLVNMLRRFRPDRIEAEVICLKEAGPLAETIRDEFTVHSELLSSKWDLRIVPRLTGVLRRGRFDAVVTVGAGDKMFWGRLAAWLAGTPAIMSALHSTGWPDGVGRLNRLLTPLTDAFIAVADGHASFLREFERFPADRVVVIRNGVDTERFRPNDAARAALRREWGLDERTHLVGIVAALRPEKNHRMFLEVCKRVTAQRPETHFVIVGDGPERQRIEKDIAEFGIAGQIHLLGTRSDTPQIVAALDLFLLCSHNEASPVSILEALACEVPVISTRVGSVPESVVPGQTGYLVDCNAAAAMASHVLSLLDDAERRREMGRLGRQRVQQVGSLTAMTEGYTQLIEKLYDLRVDPRGVWAGMGDSSLG